MKMKLMSVMVNDQDQSLTFYTETLGFVKKRDVPVGDDKWLTVVSSEEPDGMELLLEPNHNPMLHGAERTFQSALFSNGIPYMTLFVDDIQAEYERMKGLGVTFTMEPTPMGPVILAVFDDTCGNLIQLNQVVA